MKHILIGVVVALVLTGCSGNTSPKAQVDRYDRLAYTALRTFQVAEQSAWRSKLPWPTAEQHQQIGTALSKAYTLVIDVAQAGIDLQTGQPIPVALVTQINNLIKIVADIVALTREAPAAVLGKAVDAQQKTTQLTKVIEGAK